MKKTDVSWSKIKLISGGAKGIELKYSYLFSVGNFTCRAKKNPEYDLPPHDDLINKMKSLVPVVAKIESYDYARTFLEMPTFEPSEQQQLLVEQVVQKKMQSIEITGIALSERKKNNGVIISYKKTDKNDQVTGHVTAWIGYSDESIYEYGVEDDLKAIVEELTDEAFQYKYEDKHADYEQLELYQQEEEMPAEDAVQTSIEEAEVVDDDND